MLADENAAVDADDLMLRESLLKLASCQLVVVSLPVGGHENSSVDNEEVGVGSRQPMAIVRVADGFGHREWK